MSKFYSFYSGSNGISAPFVIVYDDKAKNEMREKLAWKNLSIRQSKVFFKHCLQFLKIGSGESKKKINRLYSFNVFSTKR
jgi:hypothetical protein